MKRVREEEIEEGEIIDEIGNDDMAINCLMLLSKVGKTSDDEIDDDPPIKKSLLTGGRVFACKTCNKEFSSFQALGGHRASHKKPKLFGEDLLKPPSSPPKPKTHECSICGLEFALGQALGGHMRRHRGGIPSTGVAAAAAAPASARPLLPPVRVLKNTSRANRVLCLDLNLTPVENDLRLQLGKVA